MSSGLAGLVRASGAAVVALGMAGCGGGSSSSDAVSTALMMPGVRTVVVPKQHNDLTVMVPPCSVASVTQRGASGPPPGSNSVVVPRGTLTQTVAIQPCQAGGGQTSGSQGMPPPSSTILMTPGGAQTQRQAQSQASSSTQPGQQNQLVLPANSNIRTLVVPPCTPSTGTGGGTSPQGANQALSPTSKTVTAPPCTFQQQSS